MQSHVMATSFSFGLRFVRDVSALFCVAVHLCGCNEPVLEPREPVELLSHALSTTPIAGEYTRVLQVLELGDSSVLVSDPGEQQLWRVDVAAGTRTEFGRRGDGPGEYRTTGRLARVHEDSVAVLQGRVDRPFPVLHSRTGTGRTHSLLASRTAEEAVRQRGLSGVVLTGYDTAGNVYGATSKVGLAVGTQGSRPFRALTSSPIVRFSLDGREQEVMAEFRFGEPLPMPRVNPDGSSSGWIPLGPYGAHNGWSVLPDGRLILVDAASYRVTVIERDKSVSLDKKVPWRRIESSSSAWNEYVDESNRAAEGMLRGARLPGLTRVGKYPMLLAPEMPRALPPVAMEASVVRSIHSSGGMVYIPVNRDSNPVAEYWDVLSPESGTVVATFSLPPRHRLIHVGDMGAYVLSTDELDVERLQLLQLP